MSDLISRQAAIDALEEDEQREFWDGVDRIIAANIIRRLPPAQPKPCEDAVSRQDIYELIDDVAYDVDATKCNWYHTIYKRAKKLPSVQSEPSQVARDIADIIENEKDMRVIARLEITDEQAILHLQSTGWMQRHDKEMYESGLRARLTDDSDSYDALLESEQTELCEDAVSRRRLLSDLKELIAAWGKYPFMAEQIKGVEAAIGYVQLIPSAQPEREKGKWEEIEVIPEAYDIAGVKTWASKMRCNQCGFTTFAIEGHFVQYNFCPNCGADMRGKQDG